MAIGTRSGRMRAEGPSPRPAAARPAQPQPFVHRIVAIVHARVQQPIDARRRRHNHRRREGGSIDDSESASRPTDKRIPALAGPVRTIEDRRTALATVCAHGRSTHRLCVGHWRREH